MYYVRSPRLVGPVKGQLYHLLPNGARDPVLELSWARLAVRQSLEALLLVLLVPTVEGASGHIQLF